VFVSLRRRLIEEGGGEEKMIQYVSYKDETQLETIMSLIDQELSEPYSIFTYRYFITLWPDLCFMAFDGDKCVGTIVCKMGQHRNTFRGYIAMLVVIKPYRGKGIATELVTRCIQVMHDSGCDEVTLEAEVTNKGALALYGNLGFIRAKRLHRYYLNGVDAFRLKLLFPRPPDPNNLFALAGVGHDVDHGHVQHDCTHHQHHEVQEQCAGNEHPHVGHTHHHPRWEGDYS
jgi:peptide alpha-N-acetyltransferase